MFNPNQIVRTICVIIVRNICDIHGFNNQLLLIDLLKPKVKTVLIAIAVLSSIITITIHADPVFATSAEKIPLVQHYEQFPGQEVTGFCNVEFDGEGNFHWYIKVEGLVPETQGHFDMSGWVDARDVSFTVDGEGNANSGNQIVLEEDIPYLLFFQFVACHVHLTPVGDHSDSPGIVTADLNII